MNGHAHSGSIKTPRGRHDLAGCRRGWGSRRNKKSIDTSVSEEYSRVVKATSVRLDFGDVTNTFLGIQEFRRHIRKVIAIWSYFLTQFSKDFWN